MQSGVGTNKEHKELNRRGTERTEEQQDFVNRRKTKRAKKENSQK
jgi:hypothetical protein